MMTPPETARRIVSARPGITAALMAKTGLDEHIRLENEVLLVPFGPGGAADV